MHVTQTASPAAETAEHRCATECMPQSTLLTKTTWPAVAVIPAVHGGRACLELEHLAEDAVVEGSPTAVLVPGCSSALTKGW